MSFCTRFYNVSIFKPKNMFFCNNNLIVNRTYLFVKNVHIVKLSFSLIFDLNEVSKIGFYNLVFSWKALFLTLIVILPLAFELLDCQYATTFLGLQFWL